MEAERELDALVAEKVMGLGSQWTVQQQPDGTFVPTGEVWYECPEFSTDIAAAWQVVEWMRKWHDRGLIFKVFPVGFQFDYSAVFQSRDNEQWDAQAETAPLAICLAALKVVGSL